MKALRCRDHLERLLLAVARDSPRRRPCRPPRRARFRSRRRALPARSIRLAGEGLAVDSKRRREGLGSERRGVDHVPRRYSRSSSDRAHDLAPRATKNSVCDVISTTWQVGRRGKPSPGRDELTGRGCRAVVERFERACPLSPRHLAHRGPNGRCSWRSGRGSRFSPSRPSMLARASRRRHQLSSWGRAGV